MAFAYLSAMSKTDKQICDLPLGMAYADRRLEKRLQVNMLRQLTGIDRAGRMFVTEITIEEVSETGCRFESGIPLEAGDVVAIKSLGPGQNSLHDPQPHLYEVSWTNRRVAFWVVGAVRVQGEQFGLNKFPSGRFTSKRPSK